MESVKNHPYYRSAMNSNIGRFGQAAAANKFINEGIHGAGWGFGFGKDALFNRSTLAGWKGAANMGKAKIIGRTAYRALGPALTIHAAVSGYKEGGITGAAKGIASTAAMNFAWSMGAQAVSSVGGSAMTVGVPLAVLAGVGYGTYKALQFGNARVRKQRNMELGSPIIDPFGNAATMRQRSLQALQNSQFNGRSAFGSEAALMHMPMMR